MFPSNTYAETCTLLVRLLSLTSSLRSLELRGPSPPAWPRLLSDTLHFPQFAPCLVAIKSDDAEDVTSLARCRRLEAIFITSWLDQERYDVLLQAAGDSSDALAYLQLSLKVDNIHGILAAFHTLATRFPRLLVLCVQFDLGPGWTERPLSWGTLNAALAQMGAALRGLHHLHTISVTVFPEPMPNLGENKRAIRVLGEHCDTLRHVEVRWLRRDGVEYRELSSSNGLLRGQWAYTQSLAM
ncbi:uncharacterized protein PHACADRAFT_258238 [Phanerochaete carnosa HHB-10118-sp]|uniref:Uncharacterized protein n=1 Tax=Phanerochaete carnosa (strain HHB-10118-sp) TaxID=650164 RepID=K5W5K3_PHACS|nr:uncharacterized protein PHACADRAFT_258238 [Phanerochaete carnosa HHB-10118-sp]EKM54410.1 hypothetical protein PHACADRAFT_258238 [Phanerochaete carnosa HHB-10118-sp]